MNLKAYLTEFLGTFFLVLTIGLVIRGGQTDEPFVLAPLAIGASLMIMVYMGGHVSGGHYNPAVSTAALLRGALPTKDFVPYVVSQMIGAVAAALMVYVILGKTFAPIPASLSGTGIGRALLVEFLFTFALALVVLNAATAPKTEGNSFYGLAIGFTVFVGATAGGGVSGGAYNPAVGTGPAIVDAIFGNGSAIKWAWIYWLAPIAGGALAAVVFKIQNDVRETATPSRRITESRAGEPVRH